MTTSIKLVKPALLTTSIKLVKPALVTTSIKLDDSNSTVPEPIDPLYDKLTQLHITETDIDVLQLLDTTKATGPDLINPRLIREGASIVSVI